MHRYWRNRQPPVDHKGFTCGSMRKGDSARATCEDSVERKSICLCLCIGSKCTSTCRCSNCGNNKDCPNGRIGNVTEIKRKRNNPDTYKRLKGTDYLTKKGVAVSSGPWIDLESIILHVVTEVIDDSGVALNSHNIAELYNFVVSSEKVKELGFPFSYKLFSSIVGKLSLLKEKHSLYESLMNLN